jgi:hypothetical protein
LHLRGTRTGARGARCAPYEHSIQLLERAVRMRSAPYCHLSTSASRRAGTVKTFVVRLGPALEVLPTPEADLLEGALPGLLYSIVARVTGRFAACLRVRFSRCRDPWIEEPPRGSRPGSASCRRRDRPTRRRSQKRRVSTASRCSARRPGPTTTKVSPILPHSPSSPPLRARLPGGKRSRKLTRCRVTPRQRVRRGYRSRTASFRRAVGATRPSPARTSMRVLRWGPSP